MIKGTTTPTLLLHTRRGGQHMRWKRDRPELPVTTPEYGPHGRITSTRTFQGASQQQASAQVVEFLENTVECTGVFTAAPTGQPASGHRLPPLFVVLIQPEIEDPYLQQAFNLVDQHGGLTAIKQMLVGTSWASCDDGGEVCLVKLKLEFHRPWRGRSDIAFMAATHADEWHAIAGGGIVAITTRPRFTAAGGLKAGYLEALNACLPVEAASSPALDRMIASRGWLR